MRDEAADANLLAAVAAGDVRAFDAFYDRFARPLYAVGFRWLQNAEETEELVSETLVRAWQQADRWEARRGPVGSWLFGIARHVAADQWRGRGRHRTDSLERADDAVWELEVDQLTDALDIGVALELLTAIHREVLIRSYGYGHTETQIAAELDIPVGTVKSRRFNALRAMAQVLADPAAEPPTTTEGRAR
jgi:RNA polymerase sigma-70 factor (ECF subfamily)